MLIVLLVLFILIENINRIYNYIILYNIIIYYIILYYIIIIYNYINRKYNIMLL